ncbi:MAG TPA: pyruvate kinase [Tepidiformaceae bacterium]|nr:pyruvate kinase [Tepidiformaceae bacterium]
MARETTLRRTKIVATIGPASLRLETIAAMVRAGMDVARLNTSHGEIADHVAACELIRRVADEERKPIAVLMDLGGPKLRTGPTRNGGLIDIETGSEILLTYNHEASTERRISVEYARLTQDVLAGDRVLVDDGKIELEVSHVTPDGLECRVVHGGMLGPSQGVGFPSSNLTQPALTERDREAIEAGVAAGVDFFGLSFVRHVEDVVMTRDLVHSHGAETPIIAKIERRQAVENLDEILAEADGAMVARGDLGVELPPEDVPIQQRRIIASAAKHMIPVITATQMLESMVDSPRPTRAESSDVANAVWEMSDALMLSEETAVGKYPVEAVAMMDRIIRRAEEAMPAEADNFPTPETDDHSYIVALAARRIVERDPNMQGVVCFTRSGYTAFLMSKVHPNAPIFGVTPSESVCRRLSLARSVIPMHGPVVGSSEEMLDLVDRLLQEGRHVAEGEEVVVVARMPVQSPGTTNFLKLHRIGES